MSSVFGKGLWLNSGGGTVEAIVFHHILGLHSQQMWGKVKVPSWKYKERFGNWLAGQKIVCWFGSIWDSDEHDNGCVFSESSVVALLMQHHGKIKSTGFSVH